MRRKVLLLLLVLCASGCSRLPEDIRTSEKEIHLLIWDPEAMTTSRPIIPDNLKQDFPYTKIITESAPEKVQQIISSEFTAMTQEDLCIFIVISARPYFHLSSEWNLWMPELWRNLSCRGKILIADAPWADEFLNPLKTKKADSVWVVNGRLGHLRSKLPGSLLVASCRFDEINILSRGIDGETKIPLFTWYFLDSLCNRNDNNDLTGIIETTATLTTSARERGVINNIEEVLFFNRSEINRKEFTSFPHPLIWNGLAKHIIIESDP